MHSVDGVTQNVERIAALFPNCVTERKGENGKLERAIDFDLLRQELSRDIIDTGEERYQFTWPGKREAIRLANAPTNCTLRPVREDSVDFDNTQNLYIEGDNLEVLKLLRETYLGKVKMIYIDPPYNTGNDFVYEDDFAQSYEDFKGKSGMFDENGNMLLDNYERNNESNGRFHTDWLNLMYPRLKVARDLLAEDGVIFISIDDIEIENLRRIGDEVFGNNNFLATLTRRTKAGGGSAAKHFAVENDFILVFSKNKELTGPLFAPFDEKYAKRYAFEDEQGRYFWDTMERSYTATVPYKIEAPDGTMLEGKWFRSEERFKKDLATGEVRFLKKSDGTWSVQFKQRMAEGKKVRSILGENEFKSNPQDLESIGLGGIFPFPKPLYLIHYLVQSLVNSDDIVLDFFSGSATTAHAVMQLNTEDGGKRKFIMVQLPEVTDEKSEARKAGYANICEIGKERIRRAGKKILEELGMRKEELGNKQGGLFDESNSSSQIPHSSLDVGFRVLRLDSSNMEDVYYTPDKFDEANLFNMVDNVKTDRNEEDLLFQVMLELDVPLSASIKQEQFAGKNVFVVADGHLIATFDKDVNESTVTEIAKRKPNFFVMRDASAANDNVLDNFEQIFRHYSPDTICKIL